MLSATTCVQGFVICGEKERDCEAHPDVGAEVVGVHPQLGRQLAVRVAVELARPLDAGHGAVARAPPHHFSLAFPVITYNLR